MRIRYSRWDGTQKLDALDADDLLAAMSDDLLADGDPWRALRRLFHRGAQRPDGRPMPGLGELLQRLRRPDVPALPRMIADDLRAEHAQPFGSFPVHAMLTAEVQP